MGDSLSHLDDLLVDVITPSLTNLEIIVNFNKMLETLIFQRSYAQYLY